MEIKNICLLIIVFYSTLLAQNYNSQVTLENEAVYNKVALEQLVEDSIQIYLM